MRVDRSVQRWLLGATYAAAVTLTPPASAQTSDAEAADRFFEQGRAHAEAGRLDLACPLFEAAYRLDRTLGSMLYVAACHEHERRFASAWALFAEGREQAIATGQVDRQQAAEARLAALEPRLARARFEAPPEAETAAWVLRIDGVVVPLFTGPSGTPMDAGKHRFEVQAPGFAPLSGSFVLRDGQQLTVLIGPLVPIGDGALLGGEQQGRGADHDPWTGAHTGAAVLGGVGVLGLGIGTGFGVAAIYSFQDAERHCDTSTSPWRCNGTGVAAAGDTETSGAISTVALTLGSAALAAAIVTWVLAEPPQRREPGWNAAGSGSGRHRARPRSALLKPSKRGAPMKVTTIATLTNGLFAYLALGCTSLLGLEEVVHDGAGGAGGGLTPASVGSGTTTGSGGSTSGGDGCDPVAVCSGAVPNDFKDSKALTEQWQIVQRRAEVRGGKLELEAEEDEPPASVVAKSGLAQAAGEPCAVWVSLELRGDDDEPQGSAGISLGASGAPATIALQREGGKIVAVHGSERVEADYDAATMRKLRIRFDAASSAHFETSSDGLCWQELGTGSAPVGTVSGWSVQLFSSAENEFAQFDDHCR